VKPNDVIQAYSRFAPVYDATFGRIIGRYHPLIGQAVSAARAQRVLEIGVGTGLALPHYAAGTQVVAVDLCPAMLARARTRLARGVAANVELQLVDGEQLPFEDHSFDAVTLPFVISVTPEPARLLDQVQRVLRPGGSLVMLNHFAGVQGLRWLERAFAPFADRIGFRSDLTLDKVLQLAAMETVSVRALSPLGFFTLLHLRQPEKPLTRR
jgi:phosphatidylethanolamine/phosphatidyl-N-methylethanolamine N-methyltransferase